MQRIYSFFLGPLAAHFLTKDVFDMCYTPKLLLRFYTLAFAHQEHLVPLTDTEEGV